MKTSKENLYVDSRAALKGFIIFVLLVLFFCHKTSTVCYNAGVFFNLCTENCATASYCTMAERMIPPSEFGDYNMLQSVQLAIY